MSNSNNNNNSSSSSSSNTNNKNGDDDKFTEDAINKITGSVKSMVHTTVGTMNQGLKTLEEMRSKYVTPVEHQVQNLSQQTSEITARMIDFYKNDRYTYGPHIVLGTSFVFGAYTGLVRRNRYAGLLSALIGGGISYAAVYENPFDKNK